MVAGLFTVRRRDVRGDCTGSVARYAMRCSPTLAALFLGATRGNSSLFVGTLGGPAVPTAYCYRRAGFCSDFLVSWLVNADPQQTPFSVRASCSKELAFL